MKGYRMIIIFEQYLLTQDFFNIEFIGRTLTTDRCRVIHNEILQSDPYYFMTWTHTQNFNPTFFGPYIFLIFGPNIFWTIDF